MSNIDPNAHRSSFFPNSKESKINNLKSRDISSLKRNDQSRKSELDTLTQKDARVDISDTIRDFSRIKKAVDASPEVDNSSKIARLKSQIRNGTYQVNYDELADKILNSEF